MNVRGVAATCSFNPGTVETHAIKERHESMHTVSTHPFGSPAFRSSDQATKHPSSAVVEDHSVTE